jgi:hypothetical protein
MRCTFAFRLDEIKRVLKQHGMMLALQPGVPPADAYRFLVDDYIPTSVVPDGTFGEASGDWVRIDGCSGCCDEPCFQRKYCGFGQEE